MTARPAETTAAIVQPGDTISGIAARYGLRTADVLAWNGLGWSTTIYPGQTIRLTSPATAASAPPTPTPTPPPAAAPAPSQPAASHVVASGDTLSGIARAHGVTLAAVFAANGLGYGSIIYPGQTVVIPGTPAPAPAPAPTRTDGSKDADLDAEQIANARLIIQTGRDLGVPERGIAIALAAAMVESWIRNLDWGHSDSLGLFQQRPSTGWGTAREVRDPVRATRAFFGGPTDPNGTRTRGLLDIAGWQTMSFGDAAQAVQISAYPERYGQWEHAAHRWLATYG